MKESKPAIAGYDAELIRKIITFYLNKFPVDEKEKEKLLNLFHRIGRL